MPMPQEYQIAGQAFDALVEDARDALDLATRNQAYTVLEAVLMTFRHRLTPDEVLLFADGLPAVARSMFVSGWTADEKCDGFGSRAALEAEVQAFRRDHNFAPDGSIRTVAAVLRRHGDGARFDKALAGLSPEARVFWEENDGAQ